MNAPDSIKPETTSQPKTRILLVEVYPLLRQALRAGIEKQQDFEVIAEACDHEEARMLIPLLHPDIVILCVDLPGQSGLITAKYIKQNYPDIKVLVTVPIDYTVNVMDIMQSGASGYVDKKQPIEGFIHALRMLTSGKEEFYQPKVKHMPSELNPQSETEERSKSDKLNERNPTILRYIASGMSNKEIARQMGMSLPGVKINISNILMKLHAASRTEAVMIGLKYGMLSISEIKK